MSTPATHPDRNLQDPLITPTRVIVAVLFIGMAAAALAFFWWPDVKAPMRFEQYYRNTALGILGGSDWFDADLIRSPLQSLWMALIYALSGARMWAVQLAQLGLLAGAGFLLRTTLLRLGVDRRSAGWAGIVLAVNPITIAYATYLTPEVLQLFLGLALAWLLVRAWQSATLAHRAGARSADRRSLAIAALAGAVLGLLLLTSSLLASFWPLLLLPLLRNGPWPARLLRASVFVVAMLVVTGPALYRGWQVAGTPVITDSSALTRWLGLADTSRVDLVHDMTGPRTSDYLAAGPAHADRVALAQRRGDELIAERGWLGNLAHQLGTQYFRLFDARTLLSANVQGPACRGYVAAYRSTNAALNRAVDFGAQAWHVAVLVLAALGIAAWRDWRRPWLLLVGAYVAYVLAVFGVHQVKTPAFLSLLPVFAVFAGHLVARIPEFGATRSPLTPARRMAGLALAAGFVALALLGPVLDRVCT